MVETSYKFGPSLERGEVAEVDDGLDAVPAGQHVQDEALAAVHRPLGRNSILLKKIFTKKFSQNQNLNTRHVLTTG